MHFLLITNRLNAKLRALIDQILNHTQCLAEWRHSRKSFPDEIFRFLNAISLHQTTNPVHPDTHQCRPRYDNIPLPCNMTNFPKPSDSQIILCPITPTPLEPFEQRFTNPLSRHYDVSWNNLPASTTPTSALTHNRDATTAEETFSTTSIKERCHHPLLIYTFVLHHENSKFERQTAPFNQLHQLLRQFLVINSMSSKHTFITNHPIIYAQLRYLAEQYIPILLQAVMPTT